MITTVRAGWPKLGIVERIALVLFFPLAFGVWCTFWLVLGVPPRLRRRLAAWRQA